MGRYRIVLSETLEEGVDAFVRVAGGLPPSLLLRRSEALCGARPPRTTSRVLVGDSLFEIPKLLELLS